MEEKGEAVEANALPESPGVRPDAIPEPPPPYFDFDPEADRLGFEWDGMFYSLRRIREKVEAFARTVTILLGLGVSLLFVNLGVSLRLLYLTTRGRQGATAGVDGTPPSPPPLMGPGRTSGDQAAKDAPA